MASQHSFDLDEIGGDCSGRFVGAPTYLDGHTTTDSGYYSTISGEDALDALDFSSPGANDNLISLPKSNISNFCISLERIDLRNNGFSVGHEPSAYFSEEQSKNLAPGTNDCGANTGNTAPSLQDGSWQTQPTDGGGSRIAPFDQSFQHLDFDAFFAFEEAPQIPAASPYLHPLRPSSQEASLIAPTTRSPDLSGGHAISKSVLDEARRWMMCQSSKCIRKSRSCNTAYQSTGKYRCTLGCSQVFSKKDVWKRHEAEQIPSEGWICCIPAELSMDRTKFCTYCGEKNPDNTHNISAKHPAPCEQRPMGRGRIFFRKEHLKNHIQKLHPAVSWPEFLKDGHFVFEPQFAKQCSRCDDYTFLSWNDRVEHLSAHFETDACFDDAQEAQQQSRTHRIEAEDVLEDNEDLSLEVIQISSPTLERREDLDTARMEVPATCPAFLSVSATVQQATASDRAGEKQTLETIISEEIESWTSAIDVQNRSPYPGQGPENRMPGALQEDAQPSDLNGNGTGLSHLHRRKTIQLRRRRHVVGKLSRSYLSITPKRTRVKARRKSAYQKYLLPEALHVSKTLGASYISLNDSLWAARVPLTGHYSTFFIPTNAFDQCMTKAAIKAELSKLGFNANINLRQLTEFIYSTSRKIFAILVTIKKANYILHFLARRISDGDLPINPSKELDISRSVEFEPEGLECWGELDTFNFHKTQWSFLAPTFDFRGPFAPHLDLPDNTIIPFIEDHERDTAISGGFSEVWSVRIHPDHHHWYSTNEDDELSPLIAIKRLHSPDKAAFQREVAALQAFRPSSHSHLIKLLATYKYQGKYHLMFPYAKSDLRSYWKDVGILTPNRDTTLWLGEQCLGIARGLQTIHNYSTKGLDSPSHEYNQNKASSHSAARIVVNFCHGDLKPENILVFNREGEKKQGVFVISDFGLCAFHKPKSRSKLNKTQLGFTPTYAAPEYALDLIMSQGYDIWSLGCLYLEFVTWLLCGWEEVERFSNARYSPRFHISGSDDNVFDDCFYLIDLPVLGGKPIAKLKEPVRKWIWTLREHPRCSPCLRDILNVIESELLVPDAKLRASSERVVAALETIIRKGYTVKDYLYVVEKFVGDSAPQVSPQVERSHKNKNTRMWDTVSLDSSKKRRRLGLAQWLSVPVSNLADDDTLRILSAIAPECD